LGLETMEDTRGGGVKGILDAIPPTIREMFEKMSEEEDDEEFVDVVNVWLDSNIKEITNIIETSVDLDINPIVDDLIQAIILESKHWKRKQNVTVAALKRLYTHHYPRLIQKGIIEPAYHLPPTTTFEDLSPKLRDRIVREAKEYLDTVLDDILDADTEKPKETPRESTAQNEEKLVREEILKGGSISAVIYNEYIERLEKMSDTILESLKNRNIGMRDRQDLNNRLKDVNDKIKEVRIYGRTIQGIIVLLNAKLSGLNDQLLQIDEITGMGLLYPQQKEIAQQDKEAIEEAIKNIQIEIAYLEELHKDLTKES
jgi:hypothetical protein